MTAPREEWHLDTRRLGRRVLVFDCVESTNSVAAALANEPGNDGLACNDDNGGQEMAQFRKEQSEHPIEVVGAQLRPMMAWIDEEA